ncbi:MAG: hypothetical protein KTR25_12545 [Myxococcales bacterium]|nr:hypothetical protein [Myxococcales bacterium]
MKKIWMLKIVLVCLLTGVSAVAVAQGGGDAYGKGVRLDLSEDGQRYFRFITWLQMWTRLMEMNPGTAVNEAASDFEADVALRRARFLGYGQITDDVLILIHMGINNQTFSGADPFKPQLFFHDAWVEYKVANKLLYVGAGLHYWHGISRQTNASTLNFLVMDAPITNWPLIEQGDQFARQLGVYAKGKIEKLDYRLAINRPFEPRVGDPANETVAVFNNRANSWSTAGYLSYQFWDQESNKLPYTVGTYVGTKRVFNIGAGYYYQPELTATAGPTEEDRDTHDTVLLGIDAFIDTPLGNDPDVSGALTGLLTFYYYDLGPNFIRNVGIANIADGAPAADQSFSLNGRGNAYPSIGSGYSFLVEAGYLLPSNSLGGRKLQLYGRLQLSVFEALDDELAPVIEGGLNWFLIGHHSKLTLHYRARPIFVNENDAPTLDTFASEAILQAMVYF